MCAWCVLGIMWPTLHQDELCWSLDVITFGSKQSMKQKEVTRRRFKSHIVPRGEERPRLLGVCHPRQSHTLSHAVCNTTTTYTQDE